MTGALRSALDHAQAAARERNQDFVGVEHLLLGLLHTPGAEIEQLLLSTGIDAQVLAQAVLDDLPRSADEPVVVGQLPLSPKAQRAIQFALAQAQTLHAPTVSTRLLLLALIQDAQPGAIQAALGANGTNMDALKDALRTEPNQREA